MVTVDWQMVGERVHMLRRRLGLSQAEVARRAGMSRNYVSIIEKGGGDMSVSKFLSLCEAFGVLPGTLLGQWRDTEDFMLVHLLSELSAMAERIKRIAMLSQNGVVDE